MPLNKNTDIECDGCGVVVVQWAKLTPSEVDEVVELFSALGHYQEKLHRLLPGSARLDGSYVLCEGCAP